MPHDTPSVSESLELQNLYPPSNHHWLRGWHGPWEDSMFLYNLHKQGVPMIFGQRGPVTIVHITRNMCVWILKQMTPYRITSE